MDFAIQDKPSFNEMGFYDLDALADAKPSCFMANDIVLSQDMKIAKIVRGIFLTLGAVTMIGAQLALYVGRFEVAAICATVSFLIFGFTGRIDMSFYPYSERRALYHAQGKKMSLERYIETHGFERFRQYGPQFKGESPLITQKEFSSRFFKGGPSFQTPAKRGFIFECLKSGFFTKEDIEKIETLFLKECKDFCQMCDLGLFALLELGVFKESKALKEQLFTKGAWDEAELLFERWTLIEKYHLVPKEIEGVCTFIEEHAADYARFKKESAERLMYARIQRKEALANLEKEKAALKAKLHTGYFETNPSVLRALDTEGLLRKSFDAASFHEVILAHCDRLQKQAEQRFEKEAKELKAAWSLRMQKFNQICKSYKRLALPALYFYQMRLEDFIETYGFSVLKELLRSPDFSINQEEVAHRFYLERRGRAAIFKDDFVFDLWERGLLSAHMRLDLEKKLLLTQNFLSIAHEGFIWRLLEKELMSSAVKGRLRRLVDKALKEVPASHLIAYWNKVRRFDLAKDPANAPLYRWLDEHAHAYGGMDAEFNAYKKSLGYGHSDAQSYNVKKSSFGQVVLEDERNWPILA